MINEQTLGQEITNLSSNRSSYIPLSSKYLIINDKANSTYRKRKEALITRSSGPNLGAAEAAAATRPCPPAHIQPPPLARSIAYCCP